MSVKECNGLKWFNYMGNTGNGNTPFPIIYKNTTKGLKSGQKLYKYEPRFCNTYYNNSRCSCQDCNAVCAHYPTVPPSQNVTRIVGLEESLFSVIVTFGIFVILFVSAVILYMAYSFATKSAKKTGSDEHSPLVDKEDADKVFNRPYGLSKPKCGICSCGNYFDYFLRSCFYYWGYFVAKYPWLILIVAFIVVTPLCFGILLMEITTDPVELWSSPDSQARQEKDYFDQHFGPFYRTEMLIFTSDNVSQFNYTVHKTNTDAGNTVMFNHLFQKQILLEVSFLINVYKSIKMSVTKLSDYDGVLYDYNVNSVTIRFIMCQISQDLL